MLRIHQSKSVAAAKSYYTEGLERGDYYVGHELPGIWRGNAAAMIGLSGEIDRDHFHMLCENIRPDTFGKLNPRENKDRKIGYDFTFSAPKSVSILQGVVGDDRITAAFQNSVRETMRLIEADVHVRVRKNGVVEDRQTGNLVWGEFTHFTSREIDGICDAQLHIHAYAFNTSYDSVEDRFKAGEFFHIKRDAPYYEAIFHSKLAEELQKLGYAIENKRYGFEVRGVGKENVERFSRRTQEIEALAEELGIQDNDKAKDGLAAMTRKRKGEIMSMKDMKKEWRRRLDWESLSYHLPKTLKQGEKIQAFEAVDLAIEGGFERKSVVPYRRLLADALQTSLGDCTFGQIESELERRDEVLSSVVKGQLLSTTREVLREEEEILEFLDRTQCQLLPINELFALPMTELDEDQRAAVEALLHSRNRVFAIEGRAGTGKTTLMRHAVSGIEASGLEVFTFAPTSEASHKVLKEEGFENSETIQQLLVNETLQHEMAGAVIWVDEAGLLSSREMNKLLRIADEQDARVTLSGDTRQHRSVKRGDALRLVVESNLVEVFSTQKVHRQKIAGYRIAVEHLSRGDLLRGFDKLDEIGAIHEFSDFEDKLEALAEDYIKSRQQYRSVLVVSPTHKEAQLVTREIRARLLNSSELAPAAHELVVHRNRNLTNAQKKMAQFMTEGDVVKFHQNAKGGITRGQVFEIVEIANDREVRVKETKTGELRALDPTVAERFEIYRSETIAARVGDRLRLTQNTNCEDGPRLYNGSVHTMTDFTEDEVVLAGGYRIRRDAGVLDFGYVSTSHASQGKTSGKVIVSQGAVSQPASSLEQFYVSVSRGRDAVSIYTDDRDELLENVRRSGERMHAGELLGRDRVPGIHETIGLDRGRDQDHEQERTTGIEH